MNWLLLLTSVLCFWNVWTSPTAAEEASTTRAKYHQKTLTTTSTSKSLMLAVSDGSQQHLLQLQNMQGHPVVRLPSLPLGSSNSVEEFPYSPFGLVRTKEQEQEQSNVDSTFHSSHLSKMSTQDAANIGPLSRKLSKQNNATNHTTTETTNKSSSVWSSTLMVVFLIIISVLSGGILAKRALDRFYKWEEKEQEDSLAFDIAYTTNVSEIGYGSFVSNWTGDLDKFDV
jgi:hypothetical protein